MANPYIVRYADSCRICHSKDLLPILSLGDHYLSDFVTDEQMERLKDKHAPLELVLCNVSTGGCGLLQFPHTVNPAVMYQENYWYVSGRNQTMIRELTEIVDRIKEMVSLNSGDFVLDIGSNDGTMLRAYNLPGVNLIGFEPATNIVSEGRQGVTHVFNDFFSAVPYEEKYGRTKAKVITAIAMFYDLDDPHVFVNDVTRLLDSEGVFIIQLADLAMMISRNMFDNICHEHVEYYTLRSLEYLFAAHGLEIVDLETNDVNGGSIRVYARKKGAGNTVRIRDGAKERISAYKNFEKTLGLHGGRAYEDFKERVHEIKRRVRETIEQAVAQGKKVYAYGASTKGNTLLQYFGLDHKLITAAAERSPAKWGKKTIHTMIPIISEDQARKDKPDYFLVLPWHFMKEFAKREEDYLKNGGTFIVPLPEFKLVDYKTSLSYRESEKVHFS